MKKEPLVSIVIPVYNGENYVAEAIDSALAQTYKNIEIIVVNDGSKDGTDKICKKYGDKIRYLKKENGGVSSALNLAIENMKGDYFSWLSHDDLYLPDKIERQMKYFNSHEDEKKCILFSDYLLIDEHREIIGIGEKDHDELEKKPEYALLTGSVNGITMLIPKDAFDEVGCFDVSLRCTQDYDLWLKMLKKYKFVHTREILACTRIHSSQDTKVSKNVVSEGNKLWISMIESVSSERKKELESSEYLFYKKMKKVLDDTSYDETIEFINKKIKSIEKNVEEDINDEKYLVSVVIPFYNNEKETLRAVRSVFKQTYSHFEIILVDDCSSCEYNELLAFVNQHENIRLLVNDINKGPSFSRNRGIEDASGDYVAFLDSDDEFVVDKIEKQLKLMLLANSSASYTDYIEVENRKKRKVITYTKNDKDDNEFLYNCKLATPTIMIKRDLLMEHKIRYNEKMRVCEDACFYLDILKYAQMLYVDDCLSNVYVGKDSCLNDFNKRKEGVKNILTYVYQNSYYENCDREKRTLFEGYVNFNYLLDTSRVSLVRKMYRLIPIDIRVKIKEDIVGEKNGFLKFLNKFVKFEK